MTHPPYNSEVYQYAKSRREVVYVFSIISSLLLIAGNVAFVWMHPMLWPYVFFVTLLCLYLLTTTAVGLSGRDFNVSLHKGIVARHWDLCGQVSIDIFLPICGEPITVLRNTWKAVKTLTTTHEGEINVYVLDDGHSPSAKIMATSYGFHYIRRKNNELKKAGNLRNAFKKTNGEYIIIFDADFAPHSSFIINTVSWMLFNPRIAIVQTAQFFRDKDQQSVVARGASQIQEFFYRLVQPSRDYHNAAICVGTNAVYRREALKPFGGTAPITHSEDVHTGFEVMRAGWIVKYLPLNLASGLCPDTWSAYFTQQYRWAMGSLSLCFSKKFWTTPLTFWQRISYLSGMFYYSSTGLGILFYPVPTIFMLTYSPEHIKWWNLAFTLPSFLFFTAFMKWWMTQPYSIHMLETRHVSAWSHLFAIYDYAANSIEQWVPSGAGVRSMKFYKFLKLYTAYTLGLSSFILTAVMIHIYDGMSPFNFVLMLFFTIFNLYIGLGPIMHIYAKETNG